MNVTVFGGSLPRPGDKVYDDAYRLGTLLGKAGYTVLTGGYFGTMEAVSRGAHEGGGHVVGVTCQEIESWRPVHANAYVKEERRFPSLRERLFALIDNCDVAVALPGGPGTLAEVSLLWNSLIINAISPRPLILIGPGWKAVFEAFFANLGQYINEADRSIIYFAADIDDAYHHIQSLNGHH